MWQGIAVDVARAAADVTMAATLEATNLRFLILGLGFEFVSFRVLGLGLVLGFGFGVRVIDIFVKGLLLINELFFIVFVWAG